MVVELKVLFLRKVGEFWVSSPTPKNWRFGTVGQVGHHPKVVVFWRVKKPGASLFDASNKQHL